MRGWDFPRTQLPSEGNPVPESNQNLEQNCPDPFRFGARVRRETLLWRHPKDSSVPAALRSTPSSYPGGWRSGADCVPHLVFDRCHAEIVRMQREAQGRAEQQRQLSQHNSSQEIAEQQQDQKRSLPGPCKAWTGVVAWEPLDIFREYWGRHCRVSRQMAIL